MTFARFMAAPVGRGMRTAEHGTRGRTIAAIGLLPLATGVFHWCLLAPLFAGGFNGREVRP